MNDDDYTNSCRRLWLAKLETMIRAQNYSTGNTHITPRTQAKIRADARAFFRLPALHEPVCDYAGVNADYARKLAALARKRGAVRRKEEFEE